MNENAVVKTEANALSELASRLKVSTSVLQATLKETAFKECKTNEQFIAAVIIANTYRLNPILKEIYAFPSKGGAVIPIIPIDGWISLVNRQKDFDGVELIENEEPKSPGGLGSVTAKFYMKYKAHPIVVTEYMAECFDGSKEPWKRWPRRMLRHKAYIQGARIAFGFSGVYDEDEGQRIYEATEVMSLPKADVAAPQSKSESKEKEPIEPVLSAFGIMINDFALAKESLGKKKYYEILGASGFEHANEVSTVKAGGAILKEMRDAAAEKHK